MTLVTSEPSADGMPRLLVMRAAAWPSVCGHWPCAHVRCQEVREQALRRCYLCDQRIAAGDPFYEERNPLTKDLVWQRHQECPRSES
jgi:hypothetical protein